VELVGSLDHDIGWAGDEVMGLQKAVKPARSTCDGPYLQSGPEISRAINRLTEIRTFTTGLPELDRVPPGKAAALARFAGAAAGPCLVAGRSPRGDPGCLSSDA
jgi:hypothetical protein